VSERPLPQQFRHFADSTERDGASTYTAICRGVADDAGVLALLGEAPIAQRRPNILLAAVHFLLLGGVQHDLATHYDTVRSVPGEQSPLTRSVVDDFIAFCAEHRDELVHLVSTRSTQTNEVGRCTALLPAFSSVGARYPGQPLALLDLGASAGLNLLFDHYGYTYVQRQVGTGVTAGEPTSNVTLHCVVRGDPRTLPLGPLSIAARVGVDLSPLDPTSADDARWLLACLWPDNLPRFTRLQEALSIARTAVDPPTLHRGDIIEDLAAVAATIDPAIPLIVFHSWVAAYLTAARQAALVQAVRALSATRPVHYLYAEQTTETPGLPTPPPPEASPLGDLRTAVVHLDLAGGGNDVPPVRLADMHPHGRWLRWWADPQAASAAP